MECVKSRKMSKPKRVQKYTESKYWKRAKNIALQSQSRRENEFIEDTLLPERHLSGRHQRYNTFVIHQSQSALWQVLIYKLILKR